MRQKEYVIQIDGSFSATQTVTATSLEEANEMAEDLLDDLFLDTYGVYMDFDGDLFGSVTFVDEIELDYEDDEKDLEEYDV